MRAVAVGAETDDAGRTVIRPCALRTDGNSNWSHGGSQEWASLLGIVEGTRDAKGQPKQALVTPEEAKGAFWTDCPVGRRMGPLQRVEEVGDVEEQTWRSRI